MVGIATAAAVERHHPTVPLTSRTCLPQLLVTTGKSAEGGDSDNDQRVTLFPAKHVDEEEEEEEIFCQARETATTGAESDEAVENADVDGQRGADTLLSSTCRTIGGGLSTGSLRRGTRREQRGKDENGGHDEEWCVGHVCLRLRPDGLRESNRNVDGGGTRRAPGSNNAGERSEEASESDAGSVSASDGEVCVRRVLTVDESYFRSSSK